MLDRSLDFQVFESDTSIAVLGISII